MSHSPPCVSGAGQPACARKGDREMVVQSRWKKRILAGVALAGITCGTVSSADPPRTAGTEAGERIVTVQDLGKPGQKCRVLRSWRMPDGGSAYEVQSLESGEYMTVVEHGPPTT